MKTILKFPVYVEIETGNVSRALVTEKATEILLPNLLKYLSTGRYRQEILREFSQSIGSPANVQLLTEIELLRDRLSPSSNHE
jgi:hypothetical protein